MNSLQKLTWLAAFLMLSAWTLAAQTQFNITVSISSGKPQFQHLNGYGYNGTQRTSSANGDSIKWACPANASNKCQISVVFERGNTPCSQATLPTGSSVTCLVTAGKNSTYLFASYAYNIAIYDGTNLALADPDVIVDNGNVIEDSSQKKGDAKKSAPKGSEKKP